MHLHQLCIDGPNELGLERRPIDFWAGGKPEISEIAEVLRVIIDKLISYLEKQGIISKDQTKDQEQEFQLPISDEDVFSKLQASSITYRFATGKSKGKKAIVLKALDDGDHNSPSGLVAEHSGFSLHAGIATKALERDKLERICRYIARPAVAEEKLSLDDRGDVI